LALKHKTGKEIPVAHTLSRLQLLDVDKEMCGKVEVLVYVFLKARSTAQHIYYWSIY